MHAARKACKYAGAAAPAKPQQSALLPLLQHASAEHTGNIALAAFAAGHVITIQNPNSTCIPRCELNAL